MKSRYFLLVLALPLLISGCRNEYEYVPAEAASSTMGVLFDSGNESEFIVDPGADFDGFTVTLTRKDASKDVTIPVEVVVKDDCFVDIPVSVHFAAGENTAKINIPVDKNLMPEFVKQHISIRINKDYTDYYAQSDGAPVYSASVVLTKWIRITRWMRQYSENQCDIYTSLLWLKGQNQFIIKNFLQSGRDLKFKVMAEAFDPNDRSTWTGVLYPISNYELRWSSTYEDYTSFYFVDDDGERLEWTTSKVFTYDTAANFELQSDYNSFTAASDTYGARCLFLYKYQSPAGGASSSAYIYWYNNDEWNTDEGYEEADNYDDYIYIPEDDDF